MKHFRTVELSPIPLYTQVKETLRERIRDGSYPAHAKLPAESDLQKEGLIFKIPGIPGGALQMHAMPVAAPDQLR